MSHDLTSLKTQLEQSQRAVEAAHEARNELTEKLSALNAEKDKLKSAILNRADLEAVLLRDIELHSADVLSENSELAAELRYAQTRGIAAQLDGNAASQSPFRAMVYSQSGVLDRVLLLATPAEILKRMKPLIDRLDFSHAGPPLAERQKRLSELTEEEALLLAQQTEICRLLGIEPPPRPAESNPHAWNSIPASTGKVLPGGMEKVGVPAGYASPIASGLTPGHSSPKTPTRHNDTTPNIYRGVPR